MTMPVSPLEQLNRAEEEALLVVAVKSLHIYIHRLLGLLEQLKVTMEEAEEERT